MTHQTDDQVAGPRRVLRALAALGALGVLVAAVPVVLVALTQALPLDLGALSPASWARADDGRLLLLAIVAVAWAAWVVMVLSVGLETWAAVRRVPTPTLPGMQAPQRMAAVLVASVLVALSPGSTGPVAAGTPGAVAGGAEFVVMSSGFAVDRGSVSAAVAAAPVGADLQVVGEDLREDPRASRPGRPSFDQSTALSATTPRVTTERHDTLWMLAEQYLGAGERYVEIVDLNRAVVQPDGRSLGDDGRLYPGWTLALPTDASPEASRPERHRVARGDTLWQIAEDELGDPTRYPEIADANRGDLQPDGRRLGDPDLILPGWILEIPEDEGATPPDEPGAELGLDPTPTPDPTADPTPAPASDPAEDPTSAEVPGAADPIDRAPARSTSSPASPAADAPAPETLPVPTTAADGLAALDRGIGEASSVVRRPQATSATGSPAATAGPVVTGSPAQAGSPAEAGSPAASPLAEVASSPAPSSADGLLGDPAESGNAAVALPAGGAVAALLLAGMGAELVRRRRQFQRHRRPGERMHDTGAGAQEVERAVRTAGHEPGLDLLDRALVQLGEEAQTAGLALPDVRLVRVTTDSVTLDLAAPVTTAIAPFVAADDTRWVLSPRLLPAEMLDRPRVLAGLVTLGFAGSETLLLNLESVGTLAISGSAEATADVLRGFAADLAFGPASALTERTLCLGDPSIADAVEAGGIGVEPDPVRAAATLTAVMAASAGRAPLSPTTDHAPADRPVADPLVIVLSDQHLDVRVPPRSGCALITTAPVAAGATLVIHDSRMAVLLPEREHLAPQRLSLTATRDVVEVLSAADLPETESTRGPSNAGAAHGAAAESSSETTEIRTGQAGLWEPLTSRTDVIDLREIAAVSVATVDPRPSEEQRLLPVDRETLADPEGHDVHREVAPGFPGATAPRVLVLGEVLVENAHGRCESTRVGRLAETAAFVLLNPGSRPSELQGALWPGRRSNPQTCRQMISRARTWLGRTDGGEPYLKTFAETGGRLDLRAEVGSDWADFQQLAACGLADPEDTQSLTAALGLVRGRPFGSVASRELPWADLHINEMICLITDVAHALAERLERAGERRAAREAALRGLRTESESEVLEAILARTGG